jgi:hypothetical protein
MDFADHSRKGDCSYDFQLSGRWIFERVDFKETGSLFFPDKKAGRRIL